MYPQVVYRNFIVIEPEIVPEDIMPVKNFIEVCLNDIGEEAIIKVGVQGGYTEIPREILLRDAFIELIPYGLIRIPYWYQNGESFIPPLEHMEEQISDYIEENIEKCVDLDVFNRDYVIEKEGDIEVETLIAESDVDIRMDYSIIINDKSSNDQTRISKFHTVVPVRLKKTYELAKKILEAENALTFFENMTI